MKRILIALIAVTPVVTLAQPTSAEVKKYKIQKALERHVEFGTGIENYWYYTREGHDSMQIIFGDTVTLKNQFMKGRLVKKIAVHADPARLGKDDIYTYEYGADGSYKETYTDGGYNMKSYEWHDKSGKLTKSQSPDGNSIVYQYDPKGRLTSATSDGKNNGVKLERKLFYNSMGQLTREERKSNEQKTITTSSYDAGGKLKKNNIVTTWEGEVSNTETIFEYNEKGLVKKTTSKSKTSSHPGEVAENIFELEYEYYE